TIAVGAHHAREMMADRAKRGDEQVNLLGPESSLSQPQGGENDERRADDQDEIAPGVEHPHRTARGRRARDRLRSYQSILTARPVAHVTLPSPDSARGSIAQKNRRVSRRPLTICSCRNVWSGLCGCRLRRAALVPLALERFVLHVDDVDPRVRHLVACENSAEAKSR